jgi:type I restriction enzyme S subunit
VSELPAQWVQSSIGDVAESMKNGVYKPADAYSEDGIACLRMYNVEGGKIVWKDIKRMRLSKEDFEMYRLLPGDLLVNRVNSRELVGKAAMIPDGLEPCVFESKNIRLRLLTKLVEPKLVAFKLLLDGSRHFANNAQQVVGMASISQPQLAAFPIPLPPLAEQKRIVAKIEELFSELEAGEESLRVARRQLGVYRQSLLKQAFEGKLTAQWRTENPAQLDSPAASDVSPEELKDFDALPRGWRYTRFGNSIHHIDAGKSFRCEERRPSTDEVGVAKVSAVTWGEYDEAESKTCIDPEKVTPEYFIRPGDFVLSRANTIELVGACVIVRHVTQRIMLSDKTLRITMDDALKPFFLHYLRSRQGRLEIEKRSTGNQESMRNIGQERIRSIIVPQCSLPEQQEIVRLLDEQFEVIERNEREIDAALKRSEALRQAILKKAFTGRLVPQSPADEPASALLARLRAERKDAATQKPVRMNEFR